MGICGDFRAAVATRGLYLEFIIFIDISVSWKLVGVITTETRDMFNVFIEGKVSFYGWFFLHGTCFINNTGLDTLVYKYVRQDRYISTSHNRSSRD